MAVPAITEKKIPSINDLGDSINDQISAVIDLMDFKTILSFTRIRRQYQALAHEPRLWTMLLNRDFGPEFVPINPLFARNAYRIHYLMLQRLIKHGNPYSARSREADPSLVQNIKADKKELEKFYNLDSQKLIEFLFPVYIRVASHKNLSEHAISKINACINLVFSQNCSLLEKIANESFCDGIKVPVIQKIVNYYLEKDDLDNAIKAVEKLPQDPKFNINISEILNLIVNVALKKDKEKLAENYAGKIPEPDFKAVAFLLIEQRKKDKIISGPKL